MNAGRRIGLIAGWGDFPLAVARALKRQAYAVYCLGIRGHASEQLAELCDDFRMVGIAKLGAHIRYFKRRHITQVTMAGKIFKGPMIFQRGGWIRHLPDWRCCRTFYPHFVARTQDRKDDTLLGTLVAAYAADGLLFAPPTDFAPELLIRSGLLAGRQPTVRQMKDIMFGWRMAKELGRVDVGQTVVVKGLAAIAVEAVEGTDACILRAGELCPQGGFTVVKVAKPQQDMRFDVPTIGCGTLEVMIAAGGRLLAVEAGKTIIVDEPETVRLAQRHGLTVVALAPDEVEPAARVA